MSLVRIEMRNPRPDALDFIRIIESPDFSHGRVGTRLWRGSILLYRRANTPSGVELVDAGPESTLEPMLRNRNLPLLPSLA